MKEEYFFCRKKSALKGLETLT